MPYPYFFFYKKMEKIYVKKVKKCFQWSLQILVCSCTFRIAVQSFNVHPLLMQNEVFVGYIVFSMSVILSFCHSVK